MTPTNSARNFVRSSALYAPTVDEQEAAVDAIAEATSVQPRYTRDAPTEVEPSAIRPATAQVLALLAASVVDQIQSDDTEVVATATTYEGLLAACVARRKQLGLPQIEVDELAGLQTGYTGKLECGDKRLGALSLPCLLQALGLELVVVRTTPHHLRQNRAA